VLAKTGRPDGATHRTEGNGIEERYVEAKASLATANGAEKQSQMSAELSQVTAEIQGFAEAISVSRAHARRDSQSARHLDGWIQDLTPKAPGEVSSSD